MTPPLPRVLLPVFLVLLLLIPSRAWAGPVSWREVPATVEGRQWWDEGSLRINRAGHLTVLSRFQAAAPESAPTPATSVAKTVSSAEPTPSAAPPGSLPATPPPGPGAPARSALAASRLYVMELDCDQRLYRDISINGLPQFGAPWQPTGSDDLTAEVLRQACAAEAA